MRSLLLYGSTRRVFYWLGGVVVTLSVLSIAACTADPRIAVAWLGVLLSALIGLAFSLHLAVGRARNAILDREYRSSVQSSRNVQALLYTYEIVHPRRPLPPMGDMAVSADFTATLVATILETRPTNIVELGSGTSTVISGYCLEQNRNGTLLSLDHDEIYANITRSDIAAHRLESICRVVHAPLGPVTLSPGVWNWYDIPPAELPANIDLLVIDGPPWTTGKLARYPALPILYKYLSPSAVIMVDDSKREDEQEMLRLWLKEYPDLSYEYLNHEKGTAILRKGIVRGR